MGDTAEQKGLPHCNDPSCREVYGEIIQVIYRLPGIVRIEFAASRWTHEAPVRPESASPVARVAIPLESAKALREQLDKAIEALEVKSAPFLPASVTRQ